TGSGLTALIAQRVGTNTLLLVSAGVLVVCAFLVSSIVRTQKPEGRGAADVSGKEDGVGFGEAIQLLRRSKQLQLIALLISFAAVGAKILDQQLIMATEEFIDEGDSVTAFLAGVRFYLSLAGFIIQVWLTSRIHRYLGIGFALLILPASLTLSGGIILAVPILWAPAFASVLDRALRYTVDKTTREILFLPLPSDVKYRAKQFVDVTVDRFAKGIGALVLLVLIQPRGFSIEWRQLTFVTLTLVVVWFFMAIRAKREYLSSFRRSLETRQVQADQVSLNVADLATVETLVEELAHPDEQRILYAIDVLESLDKRNLVTPLLLHHESGAVRARALAALGSARPDIAKRWAPAIQGMIKDENPDVRANAIGALASIQDRDATGLARSLLTDSDPRIVATAAVALSQSGRREDEEAADNALSSLAAAAEESNPQVREDLAAAIRHVGGAACRHLLISLLGNRQLKSGARETLVGYGESAVEMLGHFLRDANEDIWVRRHIPATLARIPSQASMDLLIAGLGERDGFLRYKVLSAIEKLSRERPDLAFRAEPIEALALKEGRGYFNWLSLHHNLFVNAGLPVESVLALTLEQKLGRSVDRIYRLLGLLYPWKDIAAARWATEHGDARSRSSAYEYLDNILASQLRSRLMPVLEEMPLDEKVRRGNLLLKTRPRDVEETLLQLINDDDQVVAAAAIDLVREKELWSLTEDVEFVLAHRDPKDWYVFEAASWTLASRRLTSDRRRELWLEPLPAAALVSRLRDLPMFASVGVDELFRIAGAGHQVRHEAASTLLHEGAVPDNLHVLLDGRVVATARRAVPSEITPPATLGFEELLNGCLMPHTVKTLEPCVSLRLSSEVMGTLLADNTDLVQGFFRTLAGRGPQGGERSVMKGEAAEEIVGLTAGPLTPIQKVLALQRLSIFSRVNATEMRHLAAIAHQVELVEGAVLSGEADPPVVCIVLSGAVLLEAPDGSMVPLRAEAGDVVGMNEALAGTEAGATGPEPRRLTVAEAGVALRIDRDDLFDLLGQRPDLLQQIFSAAFGKHDR
ncbi:MAG: Npt1/Npt2 family nucleotide transporter, partial [Vicinamibacterales bacterium]|nr:Npt1/Npt2 family nucleotide transporter [Vicinamibacterales bacterium]